MRSPDRAFLLVTHYQRLLNYVVPDVVHVLSDGRIVRSGGKELALELEEKGYGWLEATVGVDDAAVTLDQYVAEWTRTSRMNACNRSSLASARSRALARRFEPIPCARLSHDPRRRVAIHERGAHRRTARSRSATTRRLDGRDAPSVDRFRLPGSLSAEVVFVNGRYVPALSTFGTLAGGDVD